MGGRKRPIVRTHWASSVNTSFGSREIDGGGGGFVSGTFPCLFSLSLQLLRGREPSL